MLPILRVVLSKSDNDCATITEPTELGQTVATARKSAPEVLIVNGWLPYF
jgi:hypothetical protein